MSETRTIRVQSLNEALDTLTVEVANSVPGELIVSGLGFRKRVFHGQDLFDALIALRTELDDAGWRLLCSGARFDVFPSGMSRSMGGARKAYIMRLGAPATDLIDVFDEAEPKSVGTVKQQKEFHDKWIRSLAEQR